MTIVINRTKQTKDAIDGTLHIDGQYICDTVENSQIALPTGQYRIIRHYCKQYKRFMPLVHQLELNEERFTKKESRSSLSTHSPQLTTRCSLCTLLEEPNLNSVVSCHCPMLKPGNGVHHRTDGSIILGTLIVPGCLSHPLQAFDPLAERIRKAVTRGKELTLTIKNLDKNEQ